MNEERKVVLSLGSNIENRQFYLESAILALADAFQVKVEQSQFYETAPWGFEAEVSFLNCCVMFYSSCNPIEILNVTQVIEKSLGRVKKSKKNKYQSRVIDIDILYVGALVVQSQNLTIPHPLLYARGFVLVPLVELCPELIDPVKNESITQIFEQCNDENKVILYKI
jgi:2-amino-4-hydroxy-6-hydroxymethyldihydropteridine diphosphokinase